MLIQYTQLWKMEIKKKLVYNIKMIICAQKASINFNNNFVKNKEHLW